MGYNNAWIVKLPAAPVGDFSRAFIGAKLGRAKTRPSENRPWVRDHVPGKIYMAISPTPAFNNKQTFFLIDAADIPAEPDPSASVEGIGSSEWFWAEVPLDKVSFTGPNYVIVGPPRSISRAPEFAHPGRGLARRFRVQGDPRVEQPLHLRRAATKGSKHCRPPSTTSPGPGHQARASCHERGHVTDITARSLEQVPVEFSAGGEPRGNMGRDLPGPARLDPNGPRPAQASTRSPCRPPLPPAASFVRGGARHLQQHRAQHPGPSSHAPR